MICVASSVACQMRHRLFVSVVMLRGSRVQAQVLLQQSTLINTVPLHTLHTPASKDPSAQLQQCLQAMRSCNENCDSARPLVFPRSSIKRERCQQGCDFDQDLIL